MHDKCEQSNAKDTKADEVCTNKCPNKKKHIHNKMIEKKLFFQAICREAVVIKWV